MLLHYVRTGLTILAIAAWIAAPLRPAAASTLGGPLELSDEGTFFINGESVATSYPTGEAPAATQGHTTVGQMYVHFRIPEHVSGPPIVMVHGANHTGIAFETTPDGREGWATYFVRHGFPVYVVDQPGRGRSGFDATVVNAAKATNDAAKLPSFSVSTHEGAWVNLLFGPKYGEAWPDEQFPLSAVDEYWMGVAPNTETSLPRGYDSTVDALNALLVKIGPAVLLVHSQAGTYGMQVAEHSPSRVKALVTIEGDCTPLTPSDASTVFAKIPLLAVWGDHTIGAKGFNGDKRRNSCVDAVAAIKAANGPARFLMLPDIGIHGNSHVMMMDKNNLQIADLIISWLQGGR